MDRWSKKRTAAHEWWVSIVIPSAWYPSQHVLGASSVQTTALWLPVGALWLNGFFFPSFFLPLSCGVCQCTVMILLLLFSMIRYFPPAFFRPYEKHSAWLKSVMIMKVVPVAILGWARVKIKLSYKLTLYRSTQYPPLNTNPNWIKWVLLHQANPEFIMLFYRLLSANLFF